MSTYKPKILIISFVLLITIAVLGSLLREKRYTKGFSEFLQVDKSTKISGIIISKVEYRGNALIEINNGNKFWFLLAKNYSYVPPQLYRFLELGDSIQKLNNDDTIFIFRDKNKYYFLNHSVVKKQ
jgi:hypothetical protein